MRKKKPGQLKLDYLQAQKRRTHTLRLQGLAVRLQHYKAGSISIDGHKYIYVYDMVRLITDHGKSFKNDAKVIIDQMLEKGYLVRRNQEDEPESFFVCTSIAEGQRLRAALSA